MNADADAPNTPTPKAPEVEADTHAAPVGAPVLPDPPNTPEPDARIAWHDRSGAIVAGGVSQELVPENRNRIELLFQNTSAGDLWLDFEKDAALASPSIRVPSGNLFSMARPAVVSTQRVFVIGATTGQTFTVKEA